MTQPVREMPAIERGDRRLPRLPATALAAAALGLCVHPAVVNAQVSGVMDDTAGAHLIGLVGFLSAALAAVAAHRLLRGSVLPRTAATVLSILSAVLLLCSGLGTLLGASPALAAVPLLNVLFLVSVLCFYLLPLLLPLVSLAFVLRHGPRHSAPARGLTGSRAHAHHRNRQRLLRAGAAVVTLTAMVFMGCRARWEMESLRSDFPAASFFDRVPALTVIAVLFAAFLAAALHWSLQTGPALCSRRGIRITQLRGAVVFGHLWITLALMQLMAFGIPYPDGLGIGGPLLIAVLGLLWPFAAVLMALATVEVSWDRRAQRLQRRNAAEASGTLRTGWAPGDRALECRSLLREPHGRPRRALRRS